MSDSPPQAVVPSNLTCVCSVANRPASSSMRSGASRYVSSPEIGRWRGSGGGANGPHSGGNVSADTGGRPAVIGSTSGGAVTVTWPLA